MKKIRITVMRMASYPDLSAAYENPLEHACDMQLGQVFIADGWRQPEGMCDSAWSSISPFVMTLAYGGSDIYKGWMKNKKSAMVQRRVPSRELLHRGAGGRSLRLVLTRDVSACKTKKGPPAFPVSESRGTIALSLPHTARLHRTEPAAGGEKFLCRWEKCGCPLDGEKKIAYNSPIFQQEVCCHGSLRDAFRECRGEVRPVCPCAD